MESFYTFKCQVLDSAPMIPYRGDSVLHGNNVFTTFLLKNKSGVFLEQHFSRLLEHAQEIFYLSKLELKNLESRIFNDFKMITTKCGLDKTYKVRISILQIDEKIEPIIEFRSYNQDCFWEQKDLNTLDIKTLYLNLSSEYKDFFYLKTGNYAKNFYLLEKIKKEGFDDYLSMDSDQNIYEFSTSNIVILKSGTWFSPQRSENVFEGITLKIFEAFVKNMEGKLVYKKINVEDVKESSLCLSLNSVRGVRKIRTLDGDLLKDDLNNKVIESFYKFIASNVKVFKC